MKRIVFGVIAIMILAIGVSCDRKEVLDSEKDYALINAMASSRHQSDKGIDIEALEKSIEIYESRNEYGKVCLCYEHLIHRKRSPFPSRGRQNLGFSLRRSCREATDEV